MSDTDRFTRLWDLVNEMKPGIFGGFDLSALNNDTD